MKRPARILILASVALLLTGVCVAGFRAWRARALVRQEQAAHSRAGSLIREGKAAEALAMVEAFARKETKLEWSRLEVSALTALQNLPRLASLFERTPARIIADEEASVLMGHAFLHARKSAQYTRIRAGWRGHEQRVDAWLMLDTDALVLAGKPRDAEQLLRSRTLPGEADAARLMRLALVTAKKDLAGAWRLLDQAAALDPRNSDVRSFRGQILETAGRPELARVEYVAALVAAPRNPLLRDQLAEFYHRSRSYDLALDTWVEALGQPNFDFIWLKTQFWSQVLRPTDLSALGAPPSGDLEPLVRQLATLKPGNFFDTNAFSQLPRARVYAAQRQEVFWLRLLDALQLGREKEASDLLRFEPERLYSWEPELAAALRRILCFRQKESLCPPGLVGARAETDTNRPPFFVLLEEAARREKGAPNHSASLAPELASVLRGPNAFSLALLAAGWREAGLRLRAQHQIAPGEPDWSIRAFAEALRLNRGSKAALDFLGSGDLPPVAALQRAELLVQAGRSAEARDQLAPLAALSSGVGFRAAYLLALDTAAAHHLDAAREIVARQPLLAQDEAGKELLAGLALEEGKPAEAERIYRGICGTSVAAKTWFARQAFTQGRWKEARQLTNELLDLIPDSMQLRENLLAIDKAEGRR